jgi:hypothetical protein
MRWLWELFERSEDETPVSVVSFGRHAVSHQTEERKFLWDEALSLFDRGEFIESCTRFLSYIKWDSGENVAVERTGDTLKFTVLQGSKEIYGEADGEKLKVIAPIARMKSSTIQLLRRLLEENYALSYCRYSLDENDVICLRFDSYAIDGSPYKLFNGIKELAITADKRDDVLIEEFENLEHVNIDHILPIPELHMQVKYQFLRERVTGCLDAVKSSNGTVHGHRGGEAYLILDTIYRLDYLTRPEGKSMQCFEEIHKAYFSGTAEVVRDKVVYAIRLLEELNERTDEDFLKEFYKVPTTFSMVEAVNKELIRSFLASEFQHIDWYLENQQHDYAIAIPGYAIGYCMFSYVPPQPYYDLMHFFYRVQEDAFFGQLGFSNRYLEGSDKQFNQKVIKRTFKEILAKHGYSNQAIDYLDFRSMAHFAKSYLQVLIALG